MSAILRRVSSTPALLILLALNLLLMALHGMPARAGSVVGQTPADQSYSVAVGTCTGTSAQLVASSAGAPREATIMVPPSADTGIYIAFGSTVASASTPLLPAGAAITVSGRQAVNCIKAGSASVSPGVITGSFGGYVP